MNIPVLYEDECWLGFIGRVMLYNSKPDLRLFVCDINEAKNRPLSISEIALQLSNLSQLDFLLKHTHFPYRYCTDSANAHIKFSDHRHSHHHNFKSLVLSTPSPRLHFCPECCMSDESKFGVSYWHREHQFLGSVICIKHSQPLLVLPHKIQILKPPCFYLHSATTYEDDVIADAYDSPLITRYHSISKLAFDIQASKPSSELEHTFIEQAFKHRKNQELPSSQNYLIQLIKAETRNFWLKKFFPRSQNNRATKSQRANVNGLFKLQIPVGSPTYILAMATLWNLPIDAFKICFEST